MMPTGPKPMSGADGRWLALLKYGSLRMPVIRDTHDEAHAAAPDLHRIANKQEAKT